MKSGAAFLATILMKSGAAFLARGIPVSVTPPCPGATIVGGALGGRGTLGGGAFGGCGTLGGAAATAATLPPNIISQHSAYAARSANSFAILFLVLNFGAMLRQGLSRGR